MAICDLRKLSPPLHSACREVSDGSVNVRFLGHLEDGFEAGNPEHTPH